MLRVSLYQQSMDEVDPDELLLGLDSFERQLRDVLPRLASVEDFAEFYVEEGAGSRCPLQLLGMELLKYRYDLSDRELVQRCTRDLGFRYAIGLRKGQTAPSTATLTRFRAKLRELKGDDFVADRVLALAVEDGLLTDADLQAIDSTNTGCRGAVIDTYNLVAAGIRQLIRCVASCLGERSDGLARQWGLERYMARSVKGQVHIDWSDKAARDALITEEIGDAGRLMQRVHELNVKWPDAVHQAAGLLEQVMRQDVTAKEDGTFEITQGTARGRVISMTDPEARHGRKSSSKVIHGFKTHIMGTIGSQFVTGIVVTDASTHDAQPTTALITQCEDRGVKPERALGDNAYGTGANLREAAARGVEILTKLPSPSHKGSIPKRDFTVDLDAMQVTCPGGVTASRFTWVQDPGGSDERVPRFKFPKVTCQRCPLREQCCAATAKGGARSLVLSAYESELQRTKKFNPSQGAPQLLRKRSAIERLISHLVRMGMRHARFFGMHKVQFQAFMTAAACNLQRFFTLAPAAPARASP